MMTIGLSFNPCLLFRYCHAKCVNPTVLKKVEVLRKPERFCYVELRLVAEDDWTEEMKEQAKQQLKDGIRDQDPDNIPWWLHETEARTIHLIIEELIGPSYLRLSTRISASL